MMDWRHVMLIILAVSMAWGCGDEGTTGAGGDDTTSEVLDASSPLDMSSVDVSDTPEGVDADMVPGEIGDAIGETTTAVEPLVVAGGIVVEVTDACGLVITAPDGTSLTTSSPATEGGYAGVHFGVAVPYHPDFYYDPTYVEEPRPEPDDIVWYRTVFLTEVSAVAGGVEVVCATEDLEGEGGEPVVMTVTVQGEHVALAMDFPGDESTVFGGLSFTMASDEHYVGTGENFDGVDNRGKLRGMQFKFALDMESGLNEVHVPVPFAISTAGWGVFVDDRHVGAFDFGATMDDVFRVTYATGDLQVHLMADPDPLAIIDEYTATSGRPALPPYWSLAPHFWRNEIDDAAQLLDDVHTVRELHLPLSVTWLDNPWEEYYHNYVPNPVQFPNAQAVLDEVYDLGFRVLVHTTPHLNPSGQDVPKAGMLSVDPEGLYDEFDGNGWLVTYESGAVFSFPWYEGLVGAFIDVTSPDAFARYKELIGRAGAMGLSGTKIDWDEYFIPNVVHLRPGFSFADGSDDRTMSCWYKALNHKAQAEGFAESMGEAPFLISRSGCAGDQVWNTCIWPGDLDNDFSIHTTGPTETADSGNVGGIPSAVFGGLSLGASGFPCFGSDIGGYRNGVPTVEALARWMAFGTFNGVMQLGGSGGTGATSLPFVADSIWDDDILAIWTTYSRLRQDLFPYIYQAFLDAHAHGTPVMRIPWLAYPDDLATLDYPHQILFGPDLLVAPVIEEGATSWPVYLPEGQWLDWWTKEVVEGPTLLTREVPLDVIPLYVRHGAIIPMAASDIDTMNPVSVEGIVTYSDRKSLRLRIFPAHGATATFWNGIGAQVSLEDGLLTVAVTTGDIDPLVPEAIAFVPQEVTLELETALAFPDGVISTVTVDGAPCTECYAMDHEAQLLSITVAAPAVVTVE